MASSSMDGVPSTYTSGWWGSGCAGDTINGELDRRAEVVLRKTWEELWRATHDVHGLELATMGPREPWNPYRPARGEHLHGAIFNSQVYECRSVVAMDSLMLRGEAIAVDGDGCVVGHSQQQQQQHVEVKMNGKLEEVFAVHPPTITASCPAPSSSSTHVGTVHEEDEEAARLAELEEALLRKLLREVVVPFLASPPQRPSPSPPPARSTSPTETREEPPEDAEGGVGVAPVVVAQQEQQPHTSPGRSSTTRLPHLTSPAPRLCTPKHQRHDHHHHPPSTRTRTQQELRTASRAGKNVLAGVSPGKTRLHAARRLLSPLQVRGHGSTAPSTRVGEASPSSASPSPLPPSYAPPPPQPPTMLLRGGAHRRLPLEEVHVRSDGVNDGLVLGIAAPLLPRPRPTGRGGAMHTTTAAANSATPRLNAHGAGVRAVPPTMTVVQRPTTAL